jgi:hypothetical protein
MNCYQYYPENYVFLSKCIPLHFFKFVTAFLKHCPDIRLGRRREITGNLKVTYLPLDLTKELNTLDKLLIIVMYIRGEGKENWLC